MKKKLIRYTKPSITSKKMKVNFFASNSRLFDSLDELFVPNAAFAQSGCGAGSGGHTYYSF